MHTVCRHWARLLYLQRCNGSRAYPVNGHSRLTAWRWEHETRRHQPNDSCLPIQYNRRFFFLETLVVASLCPSWRSAMDPSAMNIQLAFIRPDSRIQTNRFSSPSSSRPIYYSAVALLCVPPTHYFDPNNLIIIAMIQYYYRSSPFYNGLPRNTPFFVGNFSCNLFIHQSLLYMWVIALLWSIGR